MGERIERGKSRKSGVRERNGTADARQMRQAHRSVEDAHPCFLEIIDELLLETAGVIERVLAIPNPRRGMRHYVITFMDEEHAMLAEQIARAQASGDTEPANQRRRRK